MSSETDNPADDLYQKAGFLLMSGRLYEAISGFEDLLTSYPDFERSPHAHWWLACAYWEMPNIAANKVITHLSQALDLLPESIFTEDGQNEACKMMGCCYFLLGDFKDASSWFRKWVALNPDKAEARRWLIWALQKSGEDVEANEQAKVIQRINTSLLEGQLRPL